MELDHDVHAVAHALADLLERPERRLQFFGADVQPAIPFGRAIERRTGEPPLIASAMTGQGMDAVLDAVLDALGLLDASEKPATEKGWSPL